MAWSPRRQTAWVGGALFGLSIICASAPADAQLAHRFAVHVEIGGGSMLGSYQSQTLAESGFVDGALRLGFSPIGPLAIQLSGAAHYFPSPLGAALDIAPTLGLRFEPQLGRIGRLFLDANAGPTFTGGLIRAYLDAGLGFQFAIGDWIGLGPYVRYHHVFATEQDFPSDAMFLSAGLTLSVRAPVRAPVQAPPPDTDRDGVLDRDDRCPATPAGARPDPDRPGCPLGDRDHDGVLDPDDLCVNEPAGPRPDAARRGCPEMDSDSDGITDPHDLCPSIPVGDHPDPERSGCPDGDNDADTVLNHADRCPADAQGFHPDPARPGCPLADRDGDNVPDATDACPDRPGAPSRNPRRNGCPGLVLVESGMIRILRPVYFATRRDTILPRSRAVLQAVADALRLTPSIVRVSVEGHTDDVGGDDENRELSQHRASNVRMWLIRHGGIGELRLESRGFGESRPIVNETTSAARAINRRVEFRIVTETSSEPVTTVAPHVDSPSP